MMAQIGTRRFHRARAEDGRDQLVGDERVLGGNDFVVAIQKGVAEEFEHLVRAVPEDDVFARQPELRASASRK